MNVFELFDPSPDYDGYQTEKQDNSVLKLSDLRKTRLSLDQINRMRVMNDVRTLEHEKKLKQVSKQYKAAGEEGGGAGMPAAI
jgi:hypothetical protein